MRQKFLLAVRIWLWLLLIVVEIWAWTTSFAPVDPATFEPSYAVLLALIIVILSMTVVVMFVLNTVFDLMSGHPHVTWTARRIYNARRNFLDWLDTFDYD